jgi:two-component system, OmpR family, response regulator MprA
VSERAPRILLVDDEQPIQTLLSFPLQRDGYEVVAASDGQEALNRFAEQPFDLVVLDLMLPKVDGLEVCRRMRAAGDRRPVLVLTARDTVTDRVTGLDAGADDYLVKPFALDELLARLRALLRRSGTAAPGQVLRFSDLSLDPVAHQVKRGDREIELTRTEFLLLELFMLHPRQVLTRSVIFERVWGYDFGPDSNSLEVYVSYLRRKLEAGDEPRLLHTVRGVGYVLREQ